jgi:hypothetical protein
MKGRRGENRLNQKIIFFRAEGMAQVLKQLPTKHKALNSNPSTTKNRKEKNFTR